MVSLRMVSLALQGVRMSLPVRLTRPLAACALALVSCLGDGRHLGPQPECQVAADCPGVDQGCQIRTCTSGACGLELVAADVVAPQSQGNCRREACDGAGNVVALVTDDADVPVDGSACTLDLCSAGTPSNPPLAALTPCAQGGGTFCDGAGACVECITGEQCASLVCGANACLAPACDDGVVNGLETDVDCGGSACAPCPGGSACLVAADCVSGQCTSDVCAAPVVISPADGEINVPASASIHVSVRGIEVSSLDGGTGACDGTVQLSLDGFASCVHFGISSCLGAIPSGGHCTYEVQLLPGAIYAVKVTGDVLTDAGEPLGTELISSFTVEPDPQACQAPSPVVVSQVYWGGGAAGVPFANDFVELHNRGEVAVAIDGWSLQFASVSGTTWQAVSLAGTIAPGGFHLVQLAGGTEGSALPTPDASAAVELSASGRLALVASTAALTGACPTEAAIQDLLVHGTGLPFPVCGKVPETHSSGALALQRRLSGCLSLAEAAPVPRNGATAGVLCPCASGPVNETDAAAEADYCTIQSPATLTVAPGGVTEPVYGRVYESGVTEAAGADPSVVAQLGWGPAGSDPRTAAWIFHPAAHGTQTGDVDEYQAALTAPPAPGTYAYAYRFSIDAGLNWTYCDVDGAGSAAGVAFDPSQLGVLTVEP